jgi:lysozyme family protein
MADFNPAIEFVLKNEGAYVYRANDNGGATNFGITQETLSRWRGSAASVEDVKNLTVTEAEAIYLEKYWNKMLLSDVANQELATIILDAGINRGPGAITFYLQHILDLPEDGIMGHQTVNAINAADPKELARSLVKAIQRGYAQIVEHNPKQSEFIDGWIARTHKYFAFL